MPSIEALWRIYIPESTSNVTVRAVQDSSSSVAQPASSSYVCGAVEPIPKEEIEQEGEQPTGPPGEPDDGDGDDGDGGGGGGPPGPPGPPGSPGPSPPGSPQPLNLLNAVNDDTSKLALSILHQMVSTLGGLQIVMGKLATCGNDDGDLKAKI